MRKIVYVNAGPCMITYYGILFIDMEYTELRCLVSNVPTQMIICAQNKHSSRFSKLTKHTLLLIR